MKRNKGLQYGYRSGLEHEVSTQIKQHDLNPNYERYKIKFEQPSKSRAYKPDFWLTNGEKSIIIETKGMFTTADRQKHVWLKLQHPDLDLRFVFSNPKAKLYKGSKTTYADWCDKNEFLWAKKEIPESWFEEVNGQE